MRMKLIEFGDPASQRGRLFVDRDTVNRVAQPDRLKSHRSRSRTYLAGCPVIEDNIGSKKWSVVAVAFIASRPGT